MAYGKVGGIQEVPQGLLVEGHIRGVWLLIIVQEEGGVGRGKVERVGFGRDERGSGGLIGGGGEGHQLHWVAARLLLEQPLQLVLPLLYHGHTAPTLFAAPCRRLERRGRAFHQLIKGEGAGLACDDEGATGGERDGQGAHGGVQAVHTRLLDEGKFKVEVLFPLMVLGVTGKGEEGHHRGLGVTPGDEGAEIEAVGEHAQVDELSKEGDEMKIWIRCLQRDYKVTCGRSEVE